MRYKEATEIRLKLMTLALKEKDEKIAELEAANAEMQAYQLEQDEMILNNDYNILLLQEGIADI